MPIKKNKVSYTLNLFDELKGLSRDKKREALTEVGEAVLTAIFSDLDGERSPVNSKQFAGLSEKYKEIKKELVGNSDPNLRLFGDMLDDLDFEIKGSKITWRFEDELQTAKAHNHNTPKSRKSTSPKRQFIPDDNNSRGGVKLGDSRSNSQFRSGINQTIREIINGKKI